MARENKTQFALLGYLHFSPMSGYDLKKKIDKAIQPFWNENFGHIYPVLKKLEQQKCVISHIETTAGKPDKKVYSLTEEGRKAFCEWMNRTPEPQKVRKELLLKVYFAGFGYKKVIKSYLEEEILSQEEIIESYKDIEKFLENQHTGIDSKHRKCWHITVKFGKEAARSQINSCKQALIELE